MALLRLAGSDYMIVKLKELADKFTEQLSIIFYYGNFRERQKKGCGVVIFRRAEGKDPSFEIMYLPALEGLVNSSVPGKVALPSKGIVP